jgi:sulfatase modifying factor 1
MSRWTSRTSQAAIGTTTLVGVCWFVAVLLAGCYHSRSEGDGDGQDADGSTDAGTDPCTATADIPGGVYWIGDPLATEPDIPGEGINFYHQVRLTAFRIDVHETTNGCYRECVAAGACTAPSPPTSKTRSFYWEDPAFDDYPVVNVTRAQALAYCTFRGGTLASSAQHQTAEASASASVGRALAALPRDPEAGIYAIPCRVVNCEASRCGRADDTMAGGSFPSSDVSDQGVFDLVGNVEEWTLDDYDRYAYVHQAAEGIVIDPVVVLDGAPGTTSGGCFSLGGCVLFGERLARDKNEPTPHVGLRCVHPSR